MSDITKADGRDAPTLKSQWRAKNPKGKWIPLDYTTWFWLWILYLLVLKVTDPLKTLKWKLGEL